MASELKVDTIKHTNNTTALSLDTSGNVTASAGFTATGNVTLSGSANNIGTVSAGTIGTSVTFPTRSDFGIIEIFEAGDPLITHNTHQDFSYTSGQPYFVMCNCNGGGNASHWEYYNITTSNTVIELKSWSSLITSSIPSSGTLRISVSNDSDRDVWGVLLVRMNH